MSDSPASPGRVDVTSTVLRFAEGQGLTLLQILDMVESAAKISHALGNRRYHNWLFQVENNVVIRMSPLANGGISSTLNRQVPKAGPDEFLVYEECDCEGFGCKKCDGHGDIPVIRRLPKKR